MTTSQQPDWRKEIRRCCHCRAEYRPAREAQDYCSTACKRAAAYGRERFRSGTKGPRRMRLEASETLSATPLPGSVRNGGFSSKEPTFSSRDVPLENWPLQDLRELGTAAA